MSVDTFERVDTDRIKESVDLVELARRYTTLVKTGSVYKGCCPFHEERTPSFVVYPEAGRGWFCFGACSVGGDVIDFVQRAERCDFAEAVDLLSRIVPGSVATGEPEVMHRVATARSVAEVEVEIQKAERIAEYWLRKAEGMRAGLERHREVMAQLEREGISDGAVRHFDFGYTVHDLGARSLVLPWRYHHKGREIVKGVQYRAILGDEFPDGDPRYRWRTGSDGKSLFNADAALYPDDQILIVVEGAKKAATLWSHGMTSVVAIASKSGWDPSWARKMSGFDRVIFALDPDAEAQAIAAASDFGGGAYVASLPMKPDDMLVATGGDVGLLWTYLESARRVD